jgi:hypothetical protein
MVKLLIILDPFAPCAMVTIAKSKIAARQTPAMELDAIAKDAIAPATRE